MVLKVLVCVSLMDPDLQRLRTAVDLRRTFAIISHPDAGKTTLTEKLLLYGGAVHLAGSVKQRAGGRQTTSDWMEIERQRGISISTSVLQFTYAGRQLNLLDTPGHNDFSEDTYRTLAAADAAVMLIDSVKGSSRRPSSCFRSAACAGSRSSRSSTRWIGTDATPSTCWTRSSGCWEFRAAPSPGPRARERRSSASAICGIGSC